MLTRRNILLGATALTVAGCGATGSTTTTPTPATQISTIATVLTDFAPTLETLAGLKPAVVTTVTNALKLLPSAASAIAAVVTPATTDVATFFSSAETVVNLVAGFIPGGSDVAIAIESVAALIPTLELALGYTSSAKAGATTVAPSMTPITAYANLQKLYAAKHGV